MKVKFCSGCKREVKTVKNKFSWPLAIVGGLCSFGIFFILYVLFHLIIKRKNKCAVCGMKVISKKKAKKRGYYDSVVVTVKEV